nr:hypothetical protein [uncultured Rhodopila sp.]
MGRLALRYFAMVSEEPNRTIAPTASTMPRIGSSEDMGVYRGVAALERRD